MSQATKSVNLAPFEKIKGADTAMAMIITAFRLAFASQELKKRKAELSYDFAKLHKTLLSVGGENVDFEDPAYHKAVNWRMGALQEGLCQIDGRFESIVVAVGSDRWIIDLSRLSDLQADINGLVECFCRTLQKIVDMANMLT